MNTKTSQKPSTYTRRLFVLTFKERLPGQRRGAHYRDKKLPVNHIHITFHLPPWGGKRNHPHDFEEGFFKPRFSPHPRLSEEVRIIGS